MRKLLAYFQSSINSALSYRGDVLLFVLGGVSQPLVFLAIWMGVNYSGGRLPISTMNLIHYYILVIFVTYLTSTWASRFITRDIRMGRISSFLMKPAPYIYYQLGNNLGEKTIKGIYLIPVLVIMGIIFQFRLEFVSLLQGMAFLTSLVSAIAISFLIDHCIGIAGFWMEDTESLNDLYGMGSTIFSGAMIPLALMPDSLRFLTEILPFRYLLSLPIEILQGTINTPETVMGLLLQLAWLIGFISLYLLLWRRGIRQYSAVGA